MQTTAAEFLVDPTVLGRARIAPADAHSAAYLVGAAAATVRQVAGMKATAAAR